MGKVKSRIRIDSQEKEFAKKANWFHAALAALSDEVRDHGDEISDQEKSLYVQLAGFVGEVCGRALFYAGLSQNDKDAIDISFGALDIFFAYAFNRKQNIILSDSNISSMETLANIIYQPVAARKFCQRLKRAKTNRLEAMSCIFDLAASDWAFNRDYGGKREQRDFCDYCEARNIAAEALPHIEEILLPKIKARQLASSLEAFSTSPQVPNENGYSLQMLAERLREFADITDSPEDIENWAEILADISEGYACAKMEATALVAKDILSVESVAHAFGVSVKEINTLAKSRGMKQYLACVCGAE